MSLSKRSDFKELIEGCKRGSRKSQQVVYEYLYSTMLNVCARYFSDIEEAKDVLQEAFIKVFLNMKRYNGEGSFEGWVRRIVVNLAIDTLRKQRQKFISLDSQTYEWLGEEDSNEEIEWNHTLMKEGKRVLEAVQNLTPAYRATFNLYVIEGYSHQEIADMLGVSVGTSKSNLAKAKMNLRKKLGQLQV